MSKRAKHCEDESSATENQLGPSDFRVLIVGAGGLGCELIKNLALAGFTHLDVVDMDTIELTNLNRQFLFRESDIGRPKAEVAAAFVMARVPGCSVRPHVAAIQDLDDTFYRQFDFVVCGLDSIAARRWINAKLHALAAEPGGRSLRPLIDGGSEGLMGQTRVILPGITACYECSLDMHASRARQEYPLCTLAATPRLPEHCVEWARALAWPRIHPDSDPDVDNPEDMQWIWVRATARASEFGIPGVTLELVYGVVKRIVPAVAATNAVIAGACCVEALKLATSWALPLDNYCLYSGRRGVYTHTFALEKRQDCPVCGSEGGSVRAAPNTSLGELLEILKQQFGVDTPSLSSRGRSLYIQSPPSLEKQTAANLSKSLGDLLGSGDELALTDPELPYPLRVTCYLSTNLPV